MSRLRSPGYPNFGLQEAVARISKVFQEVRRNPIGREVVAKHIGYGGISGAADKAMATLGHYGLLERAGKGEARVSMLAVDILHPETPESRKAALRLAADTPQLFNTLHERFPDGRFSEEALRSYLVRSGFQNAALGPAVKAYMDTCSFLELERAYESDGQNSEVREESTRQEQESPPPTPMGSAVALIPPPTPKKDFVMSGTERILKTGVLSKNTSFRLIVDGAIGVKEIERLIKQLELDKEILADMDDEAEPQSGPGILD